MQHKWRFIILSCLAAACFEMLTMIGFSQTYPEQGAPYIKNYTAKEINGWGSEFFCLVQDNRGMVYVGNAAGVIEFNGKEWRYIENSNSSIVREMAVDSLGRVYVGASNDFGFLQPDSIGNMKYVSLAQSVIEQGINFNDIWCVFATSQGVYFCANKYVFRYINKKVSVIPVDFKVQDAYLLNDQLYLPTLSGTYKLQDTLLVSVSEKVSFCLTPFKGEQVLTINNKWQLAILNISTSEINLFESPVQQILKEERPFQIARIDENRFLVATLSDKIIILSNDGDIIQLIDKQSGLLNGAIYKVCVDSDKNLWVCMSNGVAKIDINYPVLKFSEKQNVTSNVYASCFFKGLRYIGTPDGIYYLPPFDLSKLDDCNKFVRMDINVTECWQFQVYKGQLYALCSDGLWAISGIKAKRIYGIDAPEKARCLGMPPRFPDVFLLGLRGKLLALKLAPDKNGDLAKVVDQYEFPDITRKISKITSDRDGNLWLNTDYYGVYFLRFLDENFKKYQLTLLGENNGIIPPDHTKAFTVNNNIVLSTGEGVFQPQFPASITAPDSLIKFSYSTLFGDTIYGVYTKITPLNQQKYLIAGDRIYFATLGGGKDAFDFRGFNRLSFSVASLSLGADSIISLCSEDGLYNYNLNDDTRDYKKPFNTIISKVVVDNDSILFGGCFYRWGDSTKIPSLDQTADFVPSIDHKYNSVTFHYAALFYEDTDATEYQYQLVGFDKRWSNWSTENKAGYTNLPSGKYTFKVRAQNTYLAVSNTAEYRFSITAPWYMAWWAYLIYIVLFVSFIYFVVKIYTRRLQRQKEYLELIVEERTGEIIEQARELKIINEKLVEMDKFKQGVTSMIVHDLKNPINAIINTGKFNPEDQLERIKQTGRQMLNLVLNILDVSKYEETKITLTIENHNLLNISLKAVGQVSFLCNEKNITVLNHIKPDLSIRADAETIERVFVNILTNAVKYTPNNGLVVIDAVPYPSNEAEGNKTEFLKISIADNGIGIAADKIHLVFQKFGQVVARNSGSVRSTGLGLTYCKMVIEAHGGIIAVESESERGSVFWFTLPRSNDKVIFTPTANEVEKEQKVELSARSKNLIRENIVVLQKIEFYKVTEIMAILEKIDDSMSDEINVWKKVLINAIDTGNEPLYKKLLR